MRVTRRSALLVPALLRAAPPFDSLEIRVETGELLRDSGSWPAAVFPGSLIKPFTALAFAGPAFPRVVCAGCWNGKAHGALQLPAALAVSCNRYFHELSLRVDHRRMLLVCEEYGLTPPPSDSVDARVGLGREWRVAPLDLLRAYCLLAKRAPAPVLEGLRLCAVSGTAKSLKSAKEGREHPPSELPTDRAASVLREFVNGGALAKTGTAPCEHPKPMPGDGLAIALWPAVQPRRAMLVREHGVPGSEAAKRLRLS